MDAVWQYSFYTDTSTVTVHIRRLRAKIEADPARAALPPDRVGRRLPVPAMSVGRSLALLLAHGDRARGRGRGRVRRRRRRARLARPRGARRRRARPRPRARPPAPRLGSLRRQFAVGVAVAVGQLVVLRASLSAQLMFVSAHDALLLMVIVVFAGRRGGARGAAVRATCSRRRRRCATRCVAVGEGRALPPSRPGAATSSPSWRARRTRRSAKLAGARRPRARDLDRRRLARPAHAAHLAAAARRGGRATTSSTRATRRGYLGADAHPHRRAVRP